MQRYAEMLNFLRIHLFRFFLHCWKHIQFINLLILIALLHQLSGFQVNKISVQKTNDPCDRRFSVIVVNLTFYVLNYVIE